MSREFSLHDCTKFPPFFMSGLHHCIEYLMGWKFGREDTDMFRALPSLAELPEAFWHYLEGIPHFEGKVNGVPDGTFFDSSSMQVTPKAKAMHGGGPVPLAIVRIEGPAPQVALLSEAITAVLDFCVDYSAIVTGHRIRSSSRWLGRAEREALPLWSSFATRIEAVLAPQALSEANPDEVWLWCDPERYDGDVETASQVGRSLTEQGLQWTVCVRVDGP